MPKKRRFLTIRNRARIAIEFQLAYKMSLIRVKNAYMRCLLFKTVDSGAQKQMNKLFQKGLRKIGIFAKIKVAQQGRKDVFRHPKKQNRRNIRTFCSQTANLAEPTF